MKLTPFLLCARLGLLARVFFSLDLFLQQSLFLFLLTPFGFQRRNPSRLPLSLSFCLSMI
jgi:hypothetical protein